MTCNKQLTATENVINGSNSPLGVFVGIAFHARACETAKMDYEEIFNGIIGEIEDVQKIALRIQDSKEVDSMLTELVSNL